MQYCSKCFREIADESQTCVHCGGKPLATDSGTASDPLLGTEIREYRILAKVGEGGLGTVYKAQHTLLNEFRAIKVLREALKGNPSFMGRFLREAKILASLQHPNIATLYEFFVNTDNSLYMIMEWAGNRSLRHHLHERRLLGRPLTEPEILDITRQSCLALVTAHRKGIIHRDISTDNIMIVPQEDGELIKLIDFGIAKQYAAGGSGESMGFTQTGQFLGKFKYCSPEQADPGEGVNLDQRSDLYSLGVVMYEMITGEFPFEASTPFGYMKKRLTEMPKSFRNPANASPAVQSLVMFLMEKDREKRPASAKDVIQEIDKIQGHTPSYLPAPSFQNGVDAQTVADVSPLLRDRTEETGSEAFPGTGLPGTPDLRPATDYGPLTPNINRFTRPVAWVVLILLLAFGSYFFLGRGAQQEPATQTTAGRTNSSENLVATSEPAPHENGTGPSAGQKGAASPASTSRDTTSVAHNGTAAPEEAPAPRVGSLRISSSPGEAEVYLQGRHVGITPYTDEALPADEPFPLLLRKEGFEDWKETVLAKPGQDLSMVIAMVPVKAPEKPAPASLRVTSDPPDALVLINGESSGRTPARLTGLSPEKRYSLEVRRDGYSRWQRRITLDPGEKRSINASLTQLKAFYVIRSVPEGAKAQLQGREIPGTTPVTASDLIPGKAYDLVVSMKGYKTWKGSLPPGRTGRNHINVKLEREPLYGALKVNSKPWTKVLLNGEEVGVTPLEMEKLSAKDHELVLYNEAFQIRSDPIPVSIKANETLTKVVKFQGSLKIQSDIPLTVLVDGRKLGNGSTREGTWELFAGPHELRLLSPKIRKERTNRILIENGKTLELLNPLGQATN